ncbi:DUF3995 domain-containing protein [Nesterenkonia muleiensis]|uniref:DUF3995 domain-containing protein n=1 Tax=Nesterenkonia muleiensis TaxID=2282648 RepID=UPI000E720CD1|nr:DUF3995 domain-containing protein [Nesterenkonia muleiensis]
MKSRLNAAGSAGHPVPRRAAIAFWTAAILGTLHAASSIYWAFGGQWLLETVGQWAVEATQNGSFWTFAGLFVIGVLKLGAAWIPLLAQNGRIPGRRFWRLISWVGGPGLILYGGANSAAGIGVLAGWIGSDVPDRDALFGHAFIWGPHFALWGLALTTALAISRPHHRR